MTYALAILSKWLIGKIMIPPAIITKPGKLTEAEYNTVKMHTVRGYQILMNKNIDAEIKNTALMYHEINSAF